MLVEYVAASALGDLRAAATPAAVQTTTLSRGAEDAASFASLAARQLLVSSECYELLVAAELLTAVRANGCWGAGRRACWARCWTPATTCRTTGATAI